MTSVKICYDNEVRRVLLRGEDGTTTLTFHKLINTLYNLFPTLAGKVFSLTWQDDEGDTVVCSSDAELDDAIFVMQGKGKLLKFTVQTQGGEAPVKPKLVHAGVTCDECGVKPIVGIRYKCAIRHDYDLCEACEGKRIQPYPMIKIVEPSQAPQVLIYGLPDGTRNDEGGSFWPRGWRHGHHPHFRGPPHFAPNFSAPPPTAANAESSARAGPEGGHHRRGRCHWARRWVPADAVPTEVKGEIPVAEKADVVPEETQLEQELIEKAIIESLEINDPKSVEPTTKPKVEGSSSASVVGPAIVTPVTVTPVPAVVSPAAVAVKLSMKGVKDVTFPDGTIVQPGTIFRKAWCIRNDGSHAWPAGVALVSVGGDAMGNPNVKEFLPSLGPNEETTVAVLLTAPTSPGMYTAYYRLQTKEQQFFGNRLWATVVVSDQDPDWHVVAQKPESPAPSPVPAVSPSVTSAPNTLVTSDVARVKSEDSSLVQETTLADSLRLDSNKAEPPAPPSAPVTINLVNPPPAPSAAPEPTAPNRAALLLWRRELELLQEMGFSDPDLVIPLLQTHLGSPLSLSGDKNARPNAEGMQQVIASLLNLMN